MAINMSDHLRASRGLRVDPNESSRIITRLITKGLSMLEIRLAIRLLICRKWLTNQFSQNYTILTYKTSFAKRSFINPLFELYISLAKYCSALSTLRPSSGILNYNKH